MGLLRDCNMHIFRLKLYQPSCCEMLQVILALIYFSSFPAWVHWLPQCHRYQCLITHLLLSIYPSISKLGWLFCFLSAHQLLVHWCLHSPFQTSSNMAYYMSAIVDKVTLWAGVDSGHGELCIHHSTLQLQQPAVTLLLILTADAGGGEMYRVATLPGGHIQLAELSSYWSRDFNRELWLDRVPSIPGSGSVSIIIMSVIWIVRPGFG